MAKVKRKVRAARAADEKEMPEKVARSPREGTNVVWPKGVEARYGISAPTRWRWEKQGKLPPRDVCIGDKTGWKPSTLPA